MSSLQKFPKPDFRQFLKHGLVFLDGAMGTQLQARGLRPGEIPELWNLTHPDDIRAIHRAYFEAGADVVYANTFGANPVKYEGDAPLADVITSAIGLAREAAPNGRFVALDVGPTGKLLKPAGDFEFDAAYDAFAEQIRLGAAAGADLVAIETVADVYELKAALLAARETCNLPVIATVALSEDGKLLTGADIETIAAAFAALKPDAAGFNCGLGPDRLKPFVERFAKLVDVPVVVKANAGMPHVVDAATTFDIGPEAFARQISDCVSVGAAVVGGCCGTTPEHLAAVHQALAGRRPGEVAKTRRTVISSYSKCVEIPLEDSVVIGERINPTGKKKLKEAYKTGDTGYVLREAVAQVEAGAPILDVNVGVPGLDEVAVLRSTVEAIQAVTDVPLQLDTSSVPALENALRHYNGRALVNSVNGKQEVLDAVLPIVAKYGGVVVGLCLDEEGIPPTAEGRVAIARKIVAEGAKYGLTPDDFLIDVLCLTVSSDPNSVNVILEALRRVKGELGLRTVLGVSNVSFGLPARPLLNAAFYTLALGAGLSAAIVNPLSIEMMTAYHSWRALTGRDAQCGAWIAAVAEGRVGGGSTAVPTAVPKTASSEASAKGALHDAILHGLKDDAANEAKRMLAGGVTPVEAIDGSIVPALELVGQKFEKGTFFLPQLLVSAEAASAAFEVIRATLAKSGVTSEPKGPIAIATVKGDIHDIGKNIVRALLENYGFRVIDLGRDVPPERIVEVAVREKCRLVGLSALMTTTVGSMAETIQLLKAADPTIQTFVGGAVMTEEFAREIHADHYTKDAMASVRLAKRFFG